MLKFTDLQIKTSVIASYIHKSLTDIAKVQLLVDADLFKVLGLKGENYYDGPRYFHGIARLVDPDNGQLVAKAKTEIRNPNIKDFGYDVKNMKNQISDISRQYLRDGQFLDLWNPVKILKKKEFSCFVWQL